MTNQWFIRLISKLRIDNDKIRYRLILSFTCTTHIHLGTPFLFWWACRWLVASPIPVVSYYFVRELIRSAKYWTRTIPPVAVYARVGGAVGSCEFKPLLFQLHSSSRFIYCILFLHGTYCKLNHPHVFFLFFFFSVLDFILFPISSL